jgi:hypothetical protein
MLSRRDWVMRQVKQVADFIARALKLAAERRQPEAVGLLQTASLQTLGIELAALEWIEAASAVELLGTPERGLTLARLLEALADVEGPGAGASRRLHALEVATEVERRWPRQAEAAALAERLAAALA